MIPGAEPPNDLPVLRECLRRGDGSGACSYLHERYAGDVARFVARQGPTAPVEDVCQETWAAVLKGVAGFRFDSSIRTWLFAIAKRKVVDARRRQHSHVEDPWDSSETFLSRLSVGKRPPTSPSSQLARKERAAALVAALDRLRPADRELLEMRYVHDLRPRDIVEVLQLPASPNTVSVRIARAASSLRQELLSHDVFASQHRR